MKSSHLRNPRVCLMWVRSHAVVLAGLSRNVCREICVYLLSDLRLALVTSKSLAFFDFKHLCVKPPCEFKCRVPVNEESRWAAVSSSSVVVCGFPSDANQAVRCHMLHMDGRVEKLPDTQYDHQACGLIVWQKAIHVFGSYEEKGSRKCEGLPLAALTQPWVALETMQKKRCYFTPVSWRAAIYLCGGWNNTTIEVFDGVQMRTANFHLPEGSCTLTVVRNNSLLVLSTNFLTVIGDEAKSLQHDLCGVCTSTLPVLYNEVIYSADFAAGLFRYSPEDGQILE